VFAGHVTSDVQIKEGISSLKHAVCDKPTDDNLPKQYSRRQQTSITPGAAPGKSLEAFALSASPICLTTVCKQPEVVTSREDDRAMAKAAIYFT